MSRLIDADVLIESYCKANCGERRCRDSFDKCSFILHAMNQPTAYNVDKVVEELEERRSIHDCRKCRHFTKNGDECNEDCTDALIDDLFKIVKGGGVNA